MPKLHQIIALEEDAKGKAGSEVAVLERNAARADAFTGLTRTYRPKDDEGEKLPPESKKVQLDARAEIARYIEAKTPLIDLIATKEWANQGAVADLVLEGTTVLQAVPVTALLFLAKQLEQFKTYLERLPVLDEAEDWRADPNTGQYRTDVTTRFRTEKIIDFKVVAEPTDKHPAQVAQLSKDVTVGYWDQTKHSAALPAPDKAALIKRVEALIEAVKTARGQANEVDAPRQKVAAQLFKALGL